MPLMNLYEPLFLLLALVTVATVITALVCAVFGAWRRALRILRRLAIGAAVYFAIVIAVTLVVPRHEYRAPYTQCFDDWCIAVNSALSRPSPGPGNLMVSLRLINRARRVPMGEKGTVVYLVDTQGHRFDPVSNAMDTPLDAMLQPGQSLPALRRFNVPDDGRRLGLVYTREGGFPINWLIISEGGWFQKPPVVWLN